MKPRLESEPLTYEDMCIWHLLCRISPHDFVWTPRHAAQMADRHDADIMLVLGTIHISTGGDYSEYALAQRRKMLQGFMAYPHALGFPWMPERIARMSV